MPKYWWIEDRYGRLISVGRHISDGVVVGSGPPNPQMRRKDVVPLLWRDEKPVKVCITVESGA